VTDTVQWSSTEYDSKNANAPTWRVRSRMGLLFVDHSLALRLWGEAGRIPRFRRFAKRLHAGLNTQSDVGNPWISTRGKRGKL